MLSGSNNTFGYRKKRNSGSDSAHSHLSGKTQSFRSAATLLEKIPPTWDRILGVGLVVLPAALRPMRLIRSRLQQRVGIRAAWAVANPRSTAAVAKVAAEARHGTK